MPDASVALGTLRNRSVMEISRRMARAIYNMADEIFTLGQGMVDRIARETKDQKRISILPNTIDADA